MYGAAQSKNYNFDLLIVKYCLIFKKNPIHHLITYFKSFVLCTAMSCIITLKNPHISCFFIACFFQCAEYGISLVQKGHFKIYKA